MALLNLQTLASYLQQLQSDINLARY